jgi:hypothetical protein
MLLAGGSQCPQSRPFAKQSLKGTLCKPIIGYLAGDNPALDMMKKVNDFESKRETEETK